MPPIIYLLSEQEDIHTALKDLIKQNCDIPFELLLPTTFSIQELVSNAWVLIDLTVNPGEKLKDLIGLFHFRTDLTKIMLHNCLPNSVMKKYLRFENVKFVDIIHAPVFLGQVLEEADK